MLQTKYLTEYTIVRKYSDNLIKVVKFKYPVKQSGFEYSDKKAKSPKGSKNSVKLRENISRAKKMIFEYAISNSFEFFCTFTLDPQKYSRDDLKVFIKDLGQFIRNYRRDFNKDVQYLFIPELHKDGKSWHIHGLIKGLDFKHLNELTLDMHLPYKILNQLKKGNLIYDFPLYSNKFGYCTLSPIRNAEHCAIYITKYISKDLSQNIELNAKCYYSSRGLKKSEVILKGTLQEDLGENFWQFENEYVSVKTFNSSDDLSMVREFLESVVKKY